MTRSRRGVTLVAVLVFLTITAMIIGYAILLVDSATAAPRARRQVLQADAATVTALGYLMDEWPIAWRQMAVSGSDTRAYSINGATVNATVARQTADEYRAVITTTVGNSAESRTVTLAQRTLSFPYGEPIATVGPVWFPAGATVYGTDDPTCASPVAETAGFRTSSSAVFSKDSGTFTAASAPERVTDAALSGSVLSLYGGFTASDLERLVNISYSTATTLTSADLNRAAGPTGGSCTVGWGSPGLVTGCENFHPIVRTTSALNITGGIGQGIILVDGSLTLSGGATFYGVIINRGSGVTLTGAGTTVRGRIINTNSGATITLGSGTAVLNSSCSIARLQTSRALGRPTVRAGIFDAIGSGNVR